MPQNAEPQGNGLPSVEKGEPVSQAPVLNRRRWMQFSTRRLLALTFATGVGLGGYQQWGAWSERKEKRKGAEEVAGESWKSLKTEFHIRWFEQMIEKLESRGFTRRDLVSDAELLTVVKPEAEKLLELSKGTNIPEHSRSALFDIMRLADRCDFAVGDLVSERECQEEVDRLVKNGGIWPWGRFD